MSVTWRPSRAQAQRANITRLMARHGIKSYRELFGRSIEDLEWFWDAVVKDLGIEFFDPYQRVLDDSAGPPWARWFTGGTLNVAYNCVDRWSERRPEKAAITWEAESGETRTVSYGAFRGMVDAVAVGLRDLGVQKDDAVAIFMPMVPEAAAATMACAKIGALFVPLFSGFGPEAIAARTNDAGARVLLTADGFLRRGRRVMTREVAARAAEQSSSIEQVVVWRRFNEDGGSSGTGFLDWDHAFPPLSTLLRSEALDPEHPLLLAYTSGTTGRPKGCVHVHGGFLVKIMEEVAYQTDLKPEDVLFWVTDLGWLMGVWEIVGALGLGATVVMYEGAPDYPDPARLLRIVRSHRVSVLGLSPTLARSLQAAGVGDPGATDLSNLRILGSTGEAWDDRSYAWFFETIGGERCPIINISGGTEVGACLVSPHPIMPLKPCTVGGPALGMDVAILAEDGRTVEPGEVGELVCRKPWPSMTRGFWGDPERYIETYWSRWPDVWVHGDWASVDEDGFWFIHGRSDDTINVAGKRLGPAEVESVLSNHPAVVSSVGVGVRNQGKGEALWCFVVHRGDGVDEAVLAEELATMVAERLGKSFRPQRVLFVSNLPRTRSGKIVRRAVRAAAMREDPGDLSSLENSEVLAEIAAAVS